MNLGNVLAVDTMKVGKAKQENIVTPQLNYKVTATIVGFDMKMTPQTTPPTPHILNSSLKEARFTIIIKRYSVVKFICQRLVG